MGVRPVFLSAGELEDEWAGEPGKRLRERYRFAGAAAAPTAATILPHPPRLGSPPPQLLATSRLLAFPSLTPTAAATPLLLPSSPKKQKTARHAASTGEATCLVISDLDAGVGRYENTANTVNTQILQGTLMALCDDPGSVSTGGDWAAVGMLPRVPIYVTANDLTRLYAPLVRDGRMDKFFWEHSPEEAAARLRAEPTAAAAAPPPPPLSPAPRHTPPAAAALTKPRSA